MRKCSKCKTEMHLGVSISTTNISFFKLTDKKLYDNDDRLIMICNNVNCDNYGLLTLSQEILDSLEE